MQAIDYFFSSRKHSDLRELSTIMSLNASGILAELIPLQYGNKNLCTPSKPISGIRI